jgi:hypothetical protein
MATRLLIQGRLLLLPLTVRLAALQARLDDLLLRAEELPEREGGKMVVLPVWAFIAIIVAVILLCLLPICVIVILTLLGPTIGSEFSNIIVWPEATP